MMTRSDRLFVGLCVAIILFSILYALNPPAPRYFPEEHTWSMPGPNGAISMGWYGRTAWGFGAALLALFGTLFVMRRGSTDFDSEEVSPPSKSWAITLSWATLFSLIALMGLIVVHELTAR